MKELKELMNGLTPEQQKKIVRKLATKATNLKYGERTKAFDDKQATEKNFLVYRGYNVHRAVIIKRTDGSMPERYESSPFKRGYTFLLAESTDAARKRLHKEINDTSAAAKREIKKEVRAYLKRIKTM